MTVAQLINRLSKIPPNTAVKVIRDGHYADLTRIVHYKGGVGSPVIFLEGKGA